MKNITYHETDGKILPKGFYVASSTYRHPCGLRYLAFSKHKKTKYAARMSLINSVNRCKKVYFELYGHEWEPLYK